MSDYTPNQAHGMALRRLNDDELVVMAKAARRSGRDRDLARIVGEQTRRYALRRRGEL